MKYRSLLIIGTVLLVACAPTSPDQMGNGGMMQGSFLPAGDKDISTLPEAKPMSVLDVQDGETITLNPELVRATINGSTGLTTGGKNFALYAYNGRFPGPTLKVRQGSTFTVNVTNNIDLPTTIHWHGIRLENRFDGAAGVTQEAIEPGQSFTYTVKVPDEGMFWYHPHVREDLQQDMGLYGLLHVLPENADAYRNVDSEEYVILDDMLLEGGLPVPFGRDEADHALMGRFGNVMLMNGQFNDPGMSLDPPSLSVPAGTSRLFLLNAANTRAFNIQIVPFVEGKEEQPMLMTLVGGDAGRYAREIATRSIILSPSERAIVDVNLSEPGRGYQIVSATTDRTRLLGFIRTTENPRQLAASSPRTYTDVEQDIAAFRPFFDAPVDKTIHLSVESMMGQMMQQGGDMQHGTGHGGSAMQERSSDGIEWEDPMLQQNAMSTKHNTKWKLIDEASGEENMDIKYQFNVGDKVKIRIVNDPSTPLRAGSDGSDHPMQHPIHFHGQRFLVLAVDGKPNENLVWKDTVLVPKDATVDILLDVTNPGDWMVHCHIAEHLTNGMMGMFKVTES